MPPWPPSGVSAPLSSVHEDAGLPRADSIRALFQRLIASDWNNPPQNLIEGRTGFDKSSLATALGGDDHSVLYRRDFRPRGLPYLRQTFWRLGIALAGSTRLAAPEKHAALL